MTDYYSDKDYAIDFINTLKKFNPINEHRFVFEDMDELRNVQKNMIKINDYKSFRIFICELIYQALQNIPEIITEYTIICTNSKSTNTIVIGVLDDIDNDGEISVAKLITSSNVLVFNKEHVNTFYIANRSRFYDKQIVESVVKRLFDYGTQPVIKTSYKSAKRITKM